MDNNNLNNSTEIGYDKVIEFKNTYNFTKAFRIYLNVYKVIKFIKSLVNFGSLT